MVINNNEHTVFVYGSLKRGGRLNHLLNKADYLGEFKTEDKWGLINLGAFPGMVYGNLSVEGEAYSVNDDTLDDLDFVEGVQVKMYTRRKIPLLHADGGEAMSAWVYIYNDTPTSIASADKTERWVV